MHCRSNVGRRPRRKHETIRGRHSARRLTQIDVARASIGGARNVDVDVRRENERIELQIGGLHLQLTAKDARLRVGLKVGCLNSFSNVFALATPKFHTTNDQI
jgi:hypothetical protein